MPPIRLSKSRYMAGLQCHRQLWWRVHEPKAPELQPDPSLESVFRRGHEVGELARAQVPGGVLIELDYRRSHHAVEATRAALTDGTAVLYEASFNAGGMFAAIDILQRTDTGFTAIEVKAALSVKPQHVEDAAVQTHIAREAGLEVTRVELMHLNRECTHPHLSNLFVRCDITEQVEALLAAIPERVAGQLRMLADPTPDIDAGPHCDKPYACPFKSRCIPPRPAHAVEELYGGRNGAHARLRDKGYDTIHDIPPDEPLSGVAERQRRAVQTGTVVVEPGMRHALDALSGPIAYLDFETISPPIPRWPGLAPYACVPVQFSLHRQLPGGAIEHVAHLADGPQDPRPALAHALLEATASASTVIAWHASFEVQRIRELAAALPDLAPDLNALAERLVDLLPLVRNHLYHPDFHGSFSLKAVAPALCPELAYDQLEIANGLHASDQLEQLLLTPEAFSPPERNRLRADLLRYCGWDTYVLVAMMEHLQSLAGTADSHAAGAAP